MNDRPDEEGVDPALAEIWERNLPAFRDRLEKLQRAADAHARGSNAGREEAAAAAHKLAGSLGSFGLPGGSELARELERRFEVEGSLGDADGLLRGVAELRELIESRG